MNDIFTYLEKNKIFTKNKNLYLSAFTHSSKKSEVIYPITDNKVLGVIGNEFIALIVSTEEYLHDPKIDVKVLLKNQRDVILDSSLSRIAKNEDLDQFLMIGKSAMNMTFSDEVYSNIVSALVAAIYLDLGFVAAKDFFYELLSRNASEENIDYKTKLQEVIQKYVPIDRVSYVHRSEGPDHDLTFMAALFVCNKLICEGQGKSKKKAEMMCAKIALTEKYSVLMDALKR